MEFGNENWNSLFAAAGITDPIRHAEAAERGFRILLDSAGELPVRAVVNAQYDNPQAVESFSDQLRFPAVISVAPYFFREFRAGEPAPIALQSLFNQNGASLPRLAAHMRTSGHELGIYEINLHTTDGDALGSERTPLVAGAVSATALATQMLAALAQDVHWQCAYVLSGFDYQLKDSLGHVRLWGMTRDLAEAQRLRPTGIAVALLNRAIGGNLHRCRSSASKLVIAPFRSKAGWAAAIASSSPEPRQVRLEFPADNGTNLPAQCLAVKAPSPLATNEETEQVTIAPEAFNVSGRAITVHLVPYGLVVLLPGENNER